ncbi:MAG: hypothetical protein ACMG6H_05360 [Acidobacteriota bacterium]
MTTQQMLLFTGLYLGALVVVIYFTRATPRRIVGALAGGAAASFMSLKVIALGEALGWWHIPFAPTPYFVTVLYLGLAISLAPIYLVTWRVARRFGWRGLALCVCIVAVIGAPRDYLYAATFPKWMVFSPGVVPILADAATYAAIVIVGHAVMRLLAGPAREDRLARKTG